MEEASHPGSSRHRDVGTLHVPSAVASASQAGSPSRQTIRRARGSGAALPIRQPARQRGRGSARAAPGPPNKQAEAAITTAIRAMRLARRGAFGGWARGPPARSAAVRRLFLIVSSTCRGDGSGARPRTTGNLTDNPAPSPRKASTLAAIGQVFWLGIRPSPVPSHPADSPGQWLCPESSSLTAAGQRGLCTPFPRPTVVGEGLSAPTRRLSS
jgi:hypothetical protein